VFDCSVEPQPPKSVSEARRESAVGAASLAAHLFLGERPAGVVDPAADVVGHVVLASETDG
jgi:hypothetical protein